MARRPDCTHSEGRDEFGQPLKNDQHDCDYVDARNALIPEAESITDTVMAREVHGDDESAEVRRGLGWGRCFLATMDRLAADKGLTKRPKNEAPQSPRPATHDA